MSLASADLPQASPDALAASAALHDIIAAEITARGGWISFARYMELALYAPGLGYYSGGSRKFGGEGDFLTAPELTPLYGQALARQVAQVLAASAPQVIEAGAGSGRLAADLLLALDALGCAPGHYGILELSGELRARQQATLHERAPRLADRVEWLDELPERFSGCLVGNEVLDAMPTHALRWDDGSDVLEGGVGLEDGRLVPAERPATGALLAAAQAMPVARPHRGELGLAARAWVAELARRLECGAMLLIDYGLPRHELYHPQRDGGTVRCHYRHRVHDDPLWLPGLSDITSHVDFTAVAEAGFDAGLDVLGYTSQAVFLLNCGIGELPEQGVGADELRARGAVNVLISPNEMGETFKVIALGRGLSGPLLGFARGDRVHAL
jgi:SAM-dependent MidA family methyltransferase